METVRERPMGAGSFIQGRSQVNGIRSPSWQANAAPCRKFRGARLGDTDANLLERLPAGSAAGLRSISADVGHSPCWLPHPSARITRDPLVSSFIFGAGHPASSGRIRIRRGAPPRRPPRQAVMADAASTQDRKNSCVHGVRFVGIADLTLELVAAEVDD